MKVQTVSFRSRQLRRKLHQFLWNASWRSQLPYKVQKSLKAKSTWACSRAAVNLLKDTMWSVSWHTKAFKQVMAASEVEEVSKRLIQAVETALDPSTVQQQRVKAYEVSFKWSPEDSLRNDAEYRCSKKMPFSKNNSSCPLIPALSLYYVLFFQALWCYTKELFLSNVELSKYISVHN